MLKTMHPEAEKAQPTHGTAQALSKMCVVDPASSEVNGRRLSSGLDMLRPRVIGGGKERAKMRAAR